MIAAIAGADVVTGTELTVDPKTGCLVPNPWDGKHPRIGVAAEDIRRGDRVRADEHGHFRKQEAL